MDKAQRKVPMKYIDCVIPIIGSDANGNAEPLGSGVLVRVMEDLFLLTATHVFTQNQDTKFYYPGRNGLEVLTGCRFGSSSTSEDVSVMHISGLMKSLMDPTYKPLPVRFVEMSDVSERDDQYCITGFPEATQKVDVELAHYKAERFAYTNRSASDQAYRKCRVSRTTHIVICHSKNKAKDQNGAKVCPPPLNCMSGGAVWKLDPKIPTSPRLVGITIEQHQKGWVVATRINFTIEAIRHEFPHLSSYLPASANLRIRVNDSRSDSGRP